MNRNPLFTETMNRTECEMESASIVRIGMPSANVPSVLPVGGYLAMNALK